MDDTAFQIEFFQSNLLRKDVINQLTGIGRLNGSSWYKNRKELESIGTVKCFPMPTLLAALNVNHVDFLSLDVEGVELKVLKTFPSHDQLSIDVSRFTKPCKQIDRDFNYFTDRTSGTCKRTRGQERFKELYGIRGVSNDY